LGVVTIGAERCADCCLDPTLGKFDLLLCQEEMFFRKYFIQEKNRFSFVKKHYSRGINSYNFWAATLAKMKKESPSAKLTFGGDRGVKKVRSIKVPGGEEVAIVVPESGETPRVSRPRPRRNRYRLASEVSEPVAPLATPTSAHSPASFPNAALSSATASEDELRINLAQAKQKFGEFSRRAMRGGPWIHIGKEPSATDPSTPHTISVNQHGELGCDCRGYVYHNGPLGKTCTHCDKFARENN
jgi:hypothetical protein